MRRTEPSKTAALIAEAIYNMQREFEPANADTLSTRTGLSIPQTERAIAELIVLGFLEEDPS